MTRGKLIIIESGSDASGKATQSDRLYQHLVGDGYMVRKVSYPNYDSDSSALVKMYLHGDFGKKPEDVSPYVASTFYAADRYASYKKEWEDFYLNGGIVIADRYTTSNMVHQAAKMNREEGEEFLKWLWDFEFHIYQLPVPDSVLFLDMPPEMSQQLMKDRANKITGAKEKDIHESNRAYLVQSYETSLYIADKYQWDKVQCVKNGNLRTIDDIHEEIYEKVKAILH